MLPLHVMFWNTLVVLLTACEFCMKCSCAAKLFAACTISCTKQTKQFFEHVVNKTIILWLWCRMLHTKKSTFAFEFRCYNVLQNSESSNTEEFICTVSAKGCRGEDTVCTFIFKETVRWSHHQISLTWEWMQGYQSANRIEEDHQLADLIMKYWGTSRLNHR